MTTTHVFLVRMKVYPAIEPPIDIDLDEQKEEEMKNYEYDPDQWDFISNGPRARPRARRPNEIEQDYKSQKRKNEGDDNERPAKLPRKNGGLVDCMLL